MLGNRRLLGGFLSFSLLSDLSIFHLSTRWVNNWLSSACKWDRHPPDLCFPQISASPTAAGSLRRICNVCGWLPTSPCLCKHTWPCTHQSHAATSQLLPIPWLAAVPDARMQPWCSGCSFECLLQTPNSPFIKHSEQLTLCFYPRRHRAEIFFCLNTKPTATRRDSGSEQRSCYHITQLWYSVAV